MLTSFFSDARRLLALAAPMAMAQVGQMSLQVIDAAMIGRVDVTSLAAAAFATNILHVFLLFGFGLCMPVHILVAEARGRGQLGEGLRWLVHGLGVTCMYGLLCALIITLGLPALHAFGQPEAVVPLAQDYALYLAWSLLPMFAYQCLKNYAEAETRPWIPFVVLLAGIALNVLLNWVFIFGHWGAPAMGLSGAGLATLLVRTAMLLVLVIWIRRRDGHLWEVGLKLRAVMGDVKRLRRWLNLGVPGALQILFEAGAFILAGLMMGWLGKTALAAHHIVMTYAALVFMVPLGISFATCIEVANEIGKNDPAAARRLSWTNLVLGTAFMALFAVISMWGRHTIPSLFTDNEAVIALAASFMLVIALSHIFDGIQVVMLGAMRGLSDLKVPALLLLCSFWLAGLPLGAALAFAGGLGGQGIWWGLLMGLGCAAALLVKRFTRLSRSLCN